MVFPGLQNTNKALSIIFMGTPEQNYIHYFQLKVLKIQTILNIRKLRILSIKGKIAISNCLALVPLIYVISAITSE